MSNVYFDVTDVIEYAKKNDTVIGIPRVQLNIISLLARKHASTSIRCLFFDSKKHTLFEFDPRRLTGGYEFNGERLLIDLGLAKPSGIFPSKVQIKSYLKRHNNKVLRALKKIDVYISALFLRSRLRRLGFAAPLQPSGEAIPLLKIDSLPTDGIYVCLGAAWKNPHVWEFALAHRQRGGRTVQMVYDLIPLVYPEYYTSREPPAFVEWLNRSLEYAERFICISEWTANDLRKYAAAREKFPNLCTVRLAHEFVGFDRHDRVPASASVAELAGQRFVLCVGSIEHRKNNLAMLKIWRQLADERVAGLPKLVFAGKYGKGGTEFQEALMRDPDLAGRVSVMHAPTDRDLAWLYQNCLFTAYPSQFEGWGLPVGEAAWFGKYCVASNATSIPEVCGDLIDYVDPHDIASIAAAIKRVITDPGYLAMRQQRIVEAKLRSWAIVADEIYEFVTAPSEPVPSPLH